MKLASKLSVRGCPVCGAPAPARAMMEARVNDRELDQYSYASRKMPEYMHFRMVCCSICDLVYASPAPSGEQLSRAYQSAGFDSTEEAAAAAKTYAALLPWALSGLPTRRRAMDIGTGTGAFLSHLQAAGFDQVVGIEPSAAAIAAADPSIRDSIVEGNFDASKFPDRHFDLICCFQTLEHVIDPVLLCKDVFRLLAPQGAFLIVDHDRRALPARLMGQKSPIYDIEHLQLFSRRAGRELLSRTGFVQVNDKAIRNRYALHYWMRLAPLPRCLKTTIVSRLRTTWLGQRMVSLSAGNFAMVGYKSSESGVL